MLLVEHAGERLVVKDFAPRGPSCGHASGRFVAAREARAYRALDGHPAVPRFRGWIDALAFAVEYRPGRRMSRSLADTVPADFVARLEAALAEMHAARRRAPRPAPPQQRARRPRTGARC